MEQTTTLSLAFLLSIFASFIGAMVGGGGLITIPMLIFFGLPPQIAIATNRFGATGLAIGAFIKFWKEKKVIWKYSLIFLPISLLGGYIGANILLNVDQEILSKIIGPLIILLLPAIFIKKTIGSERRTVSMTGKLVGYLIYFAICIFGGFFGGGAGTLMIYTLMLFFGFTIIESNATDISVWLFSSLLVVVIFIQNGLVNFQYGTVMFIGMLIGSYLGAHTAVKKGNVWVKRIFVIIVIASAIKLIFF